MYLYFKFISVFQLMWAIVTQNFENVVLSCDLSDWKEALAIVLTYTAGQQFTSLCSERYSFNVLTNVATWSIEY